MTKTKLERLEQEKENINRLLGEALEGPRRGDALAGLYGIVMSLVDELIYEQERSIELGASKKSKKNMFAVFDLAQKNYCKAMKVDPAFRSKNYDAWEITKNETVKDAKAIGIKDKRTVLNILSQPSYESFIKREGLQWDELQEWKSIFSHFLEDKNYRMSGSENEEIIELRSRMELPWETLVQMFTEKEKKRESDARPFEEKRKELYEIRSRLETNLS